MGYGFKRKRDSYGQGERETQIDWGLRVQRGDIRGQGLRDRYIKRDIGGQWFRERDQGLQIY